MNNDPSLSGVTGTNAATGGSRCELVPGMSLTSGYDATQGGTATLVEDQLHYNVAALQRPLPLNAAGQEVAFSKTGLLNGAVMGNISTSAWAPLRNPGWSDWDFTLARRLPIKVGHGGNVRLQLQFYNLFNQVEFNGMYATYKFTSANSTGGFGGGNTATDANGRSAGQYSTSQPPFNFGVTIRFDY